MLYQKNAGVGWLYCTLISNLSPLKVVLQERERDGDGSIAGKEGKERGETFQVKNLERIEE